MRAVRLCGSVVLTDTDPGGPFDENVAAMNDAYDEGLRIAHQAWGRFTSLGPSWQRVAVGSLLVGVTVADPNPMPVFRLWGRR